MHSIERGNIELAVVLNGTIEKSRMSEWIQEQASVRQKVGMVSRFAVPFTCMRHSQVCLSCRY